MARKAKQPASTSSEQKDAADQQVPVGNGEGDAGAQAPADPKVTEPKNAPQDKPTTGEPEMRRFKANWAIRCSKRTPNADGLIALSEAEHAELAKAGAVDGDWAQGAEVDG